MFLLVVEGFRCKVCQEGFSCLEGVLVGCGGVQLQGLLRGVELLRDSLVVVQGFNCRVCHQEGLSC